MPFDRSRYPERWESISLEVRERAQYRCECAGECGRRHSGRCEARHGQPAPHSGAKVILTAAHLWRGPCAPCDELGIKCGHLHHLGAFCQACHLSYDLPHHVARRRRNRHEKRAAGDLFSGPYPEALSCT
jgi:hypothetical protein